MTLLLLEGFDDRLYDDGRWASYNVNGPSTSYGVDGTLGANFNSNLSKLRFAPNTTADESASMFIGARVRPGGAGESPLFKFGADVAATTHNWISINANMGLSAYRGGGGGLIGQTANNLLATNVWAYIECNSVLGDTTGDITIRVNGATQLTLTNVDTKNGGTDTKYDMISVARTSGSGASYDVDDIYICSSLTTRHNTFLGDIRVGVLLPNGTGSNSGFTPSSTGANWTKVDETTPSSTDYVSSTSTNTKDSYNFQNVSTGTVSQIIGVIGSPWVAKSDAGQTRFMRMFSLQGGSTQYGASNAVSTSYRTYETPFPTAPTGSTWTVTSLNAAQFGIQLRNT